METGIKSSFIPNAPIVPVQRSPRPGGGGFDFFILLSLVMFFASATLAVAVFLYAEFLTTSAKSKVSQLERAKEAFDPSLVQSMTRLDDRMRAADEILHSHIAPSMLFYLLERLTLQTVAFETFDFASSQEGFTLSMKGIAESVNSIALQADYLSKSGVIKSPIFSGINRVQGGVNFDFTADIDQSALAYSAAVVLSGAIQPPVTEQTAPVTTSPFGTPEERVPAPVKQGPQPQQP